MRELTGAGMRFSARAHEESVTVAPRNGTFMSGEAREFASLLQDLNDRGFSHFIVNLSACTYISSEGLGAVAAGWRWCEENPGAHMAVVLPSAGEGDPEIANLFDITGLSRFIGSAVQPSVKDALSYLRTFA